MDDRRLIQMDRFYRRRVPDRARTPRAAPAALVLLLVAVATGCGAGVAGTGAPPRPEKGGSSGAGTPGPDAFDMAPWGRPRCWGLPGEEDLGALFDGDPRTVWSPPAGARAVGVEWERRRDVYAVVVRFAGPPPGPETIAVEYWFHKWPNEGRGGWKELDDPFNGQWIEARVESEGGQAGTFTFSKLSRGENPAIDPRRADPRDAAAPFRRTLKVRIRAREGSLPPMAGLEAYGRSVWGEARVDVEMGCEAPSPDTREGAVEIENGEILAVDPLPRPRDAVVTGPRRWKVAARPGRTAGIRVHLRHVLSPDPTSNDLTIVTVRSGAASFSFLVRDVLEEGGMYLPDFGAFLSRSDLGICFPDWKGPKGRWASRVRERVRKEPEQSLERAMAEIPAKPPRWIPLGVPSARQEVEVGPEGDWAFLMGPRGSLRTEGKDSELCPWRSDRVVTTLSMASGPASDGGGRGGPVRRWLEDGTLPIVHVEWREGPLRYHQTLAAALLRGGIEVETGEEPLVLLARLAVRNEGGPPGQAVPAGTARAEVSLRVSPDLPLGLEPGGILRIDSVPPGGARPGLTPVWCRVDPRGGNLALEQVPIPSAEKDRGGGDTEKRSMVRWSAEIPAGAEREVDFIDPFPQLLDAGELERLRSLRYDQEMRRIREFWRGALARGAEIEVPDRPISEFYRANLWHILISTDRDPGTGLEMHGAATARYPVFPNETCMVVRSLEMRGLHDEAARLLEPFLFYQGSKMLPGNFRTSDGCFYGVGPYTAQGYNMHHGWVLHAVAEHFRWTRDRAYLDRVLHRLLAGARWITRERAATKRSLPGGARVPEYGLAPAGDLEDVAEYLYWYATNAYYHLGLAEVAAVLGEIGHPEAPALRAEAEAYREDILASAREATVRAPAVKLLDGTYIPYVPPRVGAAYHRREGWIREALYGPLHLLNGRLLPAGAREVSWILDELEDNIFMGPESGYPVEVDRDWFSRGGITLQPNLLDTTVAYLLRDEIPAAVRAFYNTFAASYYPDARCFAEWVPRFGEGGGPLYKTPDEAKFVQWLRLILVLEEADRLFLGRGIPRAWFAGGKRVAVRGAATFFGPVSFEIRSGSDRVRASIDPPRRSPPRQIIVRMGHPRGRGWVRVLVNGSPWSRLDPERNWVILPGSGADRWEIEVEYEPG